AQGARQWGASKRVQQPNHREGNRTVADEVDHLLKDVLGVMVKAHYEPAHDFHPVALDAIYRIKQAPPHVLLLLRLLEAVFVRRFDAQEDPAEPGLSHSFE